MRSKITAGGIFLALNLMVSSISFANGFKAMAKELSQAAKKADIERVAVLPFISVDGGNSKGGWSIAEKRSDHEKENPSIEFARSTPQRVGMRGPGRNV